VGWKRLRNFSPIVVAAADRTAGTPEADGWRKVTVPIESIGDAAIQMLQLSGEAKSSSRRRCARHCTPRARAWPH
jgi:hypothetical protein